MVTEGLRQRRAGARAVHKAHAWTQAIHLGEASAASCLRCRAIGLALAGFVAGALLVDRELA